MTMTKVDIIASTDSWIDQTAVDPLTSAATGLSA